LTTLGLSALVLLVAGGFYLWSTRKPPPAPAKDYTVADPVRIGGIWQCPHSAPVAGYGPGRTFYPLGHPAVPGPATRPQRCFASEARAARDGYQPAPPPAGLPVIDGVYLAAVEPASWDFCEAAARRAGFAVPCPGLLPSFSRRTVDVDCGGRPEPTCGFIDPLLRGTKWFGFDISFGGPSSYSGTVVGGAVISGRLNVHGVRTADPNAAMVTGCSFEAAQSIAPIRGQPAQLVACLPSRAGTELNRGFVLVRWSEGPATYSVGLYQDNETNRQLAQAVASRVRLAQPI
jgi:hypothetical protein